MRVFILAVIPFYVSVAFAGPGGTSLPHLAKGKCQSLLHAPEALKVATASLLSARTSVDNRLLAREKITAFVAAAPLNSDDLVTYLRELNEDSPRQRRYTISSYAEKLLISYFTRPANGELALRHIESLLDAFYQDFVYGDEDYLLNYLGDHRERHIQGFAVSDSVITLLLDLAKANPEPARAAWNGFNKNRMSGILNVDSIAEVFRRTRLYLESDAVHSQAERNEDDEYFAEGDKDDPIYRERMRMNYVIDIIRELDLAPPAADLDSFAKFYFLPENPFPTNEIFEMNLENWWGSDMESMFPLRTLILLIRLSRRMNDLLPDPTFQKIETEISKIKKLHAVFRSHHHYPPGM